MKVRVHIYVSGRVQGVFFRIRTQQEANKRNIKGWVRNLPDGRVEAVFEGKEKEVKELIAFCRKGPPYSIVKDIEINWDNFKGEFKGFNIR